MRFDRALRSSSAVPLAFLVVAMCSVQTGAAIAQHLFPVVGPEGTTALRLSLAACLLLALRRPTLRGLTTAGRRAILTYGFALGGMNILFYLAIARIPLGDAVTVEFAGPLALAVLSHRKWMDIVWLALAAIGLMLLAPFGRGHTAIDPMGLILALGAGGCWAVYIVSGQHAGAAYPGGATALGMLTAAILVFPVGLLRAGPMLFQPSLLPIAALIAVLSSALPYSLEMFALGRVPRPTYGAIMSLEPAVAALSGFIFLGQHLTTREGMAIACVMLASAGAAIAYLRADAETADEVEIRNKGTTLADEVL